MLRQSLKSVPGAIDALTALGIDETRRAETLTIAEWISLARALGG
jgi:16S rRNA (adenine1518-N6/adenine1519-N6)-dimethyltransferase